jgi:hypothetical protein
MRDLTSPFKPIALGIAALALISLSNGVAKADEVTVAGYTNGCFNCATPPNASAVQQDSLSGLAYTNSTFNGTTALGFRSLRCRSGSAGNASCQQLRIGLS